MIPLLCGGIYIIATLLRLNLPPLKHTSLFLFTLAEMVIILSHIRVLYFQKSLKKRQFFLKSLFFPGKQIANSEVQSFFVCFFFFLPLSAPCVASSLYLTIFFAETETCRECFLCSGGVGKAEREEEEEEEGSREIIV